MTTGDPKNETQRQTLIELLGIDREKTRVLDYKIVALLKANIPPGAESVAALMVVASRAAAANGMPFVLAVSLLEWMYDIQKVSDLGMIQQMPVSTGAQH